MIMIECVRKQFGGIMKRGIALGSILVVGAFAITVGGVQTLPSAAVEATAIEQVRNNLYVITGSDASSRETFSGGNTGVFVTAEGVTIVDTKLPGWGQVLLERIRTVTDKPITTIINTHTHGDHTGSNTFFPAAVEIVAHENTRTNMERMDSFAGENATYLPNRTYADRLTLGAGRDQIDLYYLGAGHTNGDTFIVYTALGVMQTGDMFPWKDAPFLDRANGGSGVEFPRTLSRAIRRIEESSLQPYGAPDLIVPGHIPVTTWAALEEYQRFVSDLLQAVRNALAAGQSASEAAESIDLTDQYPTYESNRMAAAIEAIYEELQP